MVGKLSLIAAFGAGYVVGARAGRERYDQIAGKATDFWRDPRVQKTAEQAQHVAKDTAAQAGHVAKEKAAQAQDSVKEKLSSGGESGA